MEPLAMHHVRSYAGSWEDPLPGWEQGDVVDELTLCAG